MKTLYDYLVFRNNGVNFTIEELIQFRAIADNNNLFDYTNRKGEIIYGCKVVYYPLPYSKNLEACIEYFTDDENDKNHEPKKVYDECQVKYLTERKPF
jgi:hypothetical protein